MEADLSTLRLAATALLNLAMALVLGASISIAWLGKEPSSWAATHARTLGQVSLAASLSALVATLVLLWLEAASMAEVPLAQAWPAVRSVLASTHFGMAWLIGAGALLVLVGAAACGKHMPSALRIPVKLAAIAVFLLSRSMISHAGAMGDLTFAVAADWVHLVLIALWVGEVLVAGLITLRSAPGSAEPDRVSCARYVQGLSDSATVALVGIFLTGFIAAWRSLGSIDNTFGNPYATILWIKLAGVGGAALLGGFNRFVVMPGLLDGLRSPGQNGTAHARRFALILQVEAVLLIGVLVAAALLSSTSPPTAG